MGLTEYAISQSLYMGLNHIDKKELVKRVAEEFDKLTDSRLGEKGSEKLQAQIVEKVLLPLARELYKENPLGWQYALTKEREEVSKLIGGGSLISGELGPIPGRERSNVQAKNRRA